MKTISIYSRSYLLVTLGLALLHGCGTVESVKASFRIDEALGFGNTEAEIGCPSESNGSNIGSLQPVNLNCYKLPGTSKTAYDLAVECAQKEGVGTAGTQNERLCQFYRNEFQSVIIRRSNAICDQHKGDIVSQAALVNAGLGIGAVGTSSLGAVIAGVHAKTNLAALTAFLTGSQAIVNQEFYQKQFAAAIIRAIDTSRESKKGDIEQKRARLSNAYTIDDALADAQEYHYRCSFYNGVTAVTKAVERQDQTSRAKLLQRIDVLRGEADKTDKMTGISTPEKDKLKAGITAQILDLQQLIKAATD
jgi:hypothetical protein